MTEGFYTIKDTRESPDGAVFHICLNPESPLFKGHFPGHPILPGVCSMRIIRECAERMSGRHMRYGKVKLCRFSSVITPGSPEAFDVHVSLTDDGWLSATIAYDDVQYVHITSLMKA